MRILALAAMLVLATPAAKADDVQALCTAQAHFARSALSARQAGVPLHEALGALQTVTPTSSHTLHTVIDLTVGAYQIPKSELTPIVEAKTRYGDEARDQCLALLRE